MSGVEGCDRVYACAGAGPPCRSLVASCARSAGVAVGHLLLAWLLMAPAVALGQPGVDVVVLVDTSGSMRRTDPDGLRVPAVRLLVRLLGPEDRLSIIRFDERADTVVGLTPVEPREVPTLLAAAGSAPATGRWTNLYAAVEAGLRSLEVGRRPDATAVIILLTDGQMDTGDAGRDRELVEDLKSGLAARLAAAGVRAHALAFTHHADLGLLEDFAGGTGGLARLARTGGDLHRVFAELFEVVKRPQAVAVDHGRFPVDATVHKMTVVADRPGGSGRTVLVDPGGGRLDGRRTVDGVSWAESPAFSLVTVREPVPGVWALQGGTQSGSVYVAADLRLVADLHGDSAAVGGPVPVVAWLEDSAERVRDLDRLKGVALTAHLQKGSGGGADAEGGPPVTLHLDAERAEFVGTVTPGRAGPAVVEVQASGPGFQRVQRLALQVRTADPDGAPAPVPAAPSTGPSVAAAAPQPAPATPDGPARVAQPAAPSADEAPSSAQGPVDWPLALGTLALVNLALAALGGAVALWRRRTQPGPPAVDAHA